MVIGSVKMVRIGFTKVFNTPRTTAITIAVRKFSIWIPGRIYPVMNTAMALTIREINIAIVMLVKGLWAGQLVW